MDHGHHHVLHHQYSVNIDGVGGSSDNRFPQWSNQETQDFLLIRAELDPAFMETKRNKLLWEVISTRMNEKGYHRSVEQCKCKWKNLVTRYKGCETMEAEGMRQQFPFYNELQTIFTARMQRMLWHEAEGGGGGGAATTSNKTAAAHFSSDEDDENNDLSEGEKVVGAPKKKRKKKSTTTNTTNIKSHSNHVVINGVREMMDDFMKQQMENEMQWLRAYEKREEERRVREMEWRQRMEALENERLMMERRWRERDEQRKIRDEQRADKRDALVMVLLNKLRREEN